MKPNVGCFVFIGFFLICALGGFDTGFLFVVWLYGFNLINNND